MATVFENPDQVILDDENADEDTITVVNDSELQPPAKRRRGPGKKNCKAHIFTPLYSSCITHIF